MRPAIRVLIVLSALLAFHETNVSAGASSLFTFVHDLIQNNVAGVPVIHEKTEWDFDPDLGQKRRVRYEQENGRRGEDAIAKIGMGIGFKGPWGRKVENGNEKTVRHV